MKKYPNVYADFAYTITNKTATNNLIQVLMSDPLVRKRTMYGSDFWVVNKEGELKEKQKAFLDMLQDVDPSLVHDLCIANPMQYLFGK